MHIIIKLIVHHRQLRNVFFKYKNVSHSIRTVFPQKLFTSKTFSYKIIQSVTNDANYI